MVDSVDTTAQPFLFFDRSPHIPSALSAHTAFSYVGHVIN